MGYEIKNREYFEERIHKHKMYWNFLETIAEINLEILTTNQQVLKELKKMNKLLEAL